MVQMHPDLIDRPFVPHNLDISPGEPRLPPQFQTASDLNINILWVQGRNSNILFLVCAGTFICGQLNVERLYECLLESLKKKPSSKMGNNIRSPFTEPHLDRRPT
jgi:hypothetical protein